MAEPLDDVDTETLLVIHAIAQAVPGSASCDCHVNLEDEDFTCGYCRFVAAGIYDHLYDSGWRITRWETALFDGGES